MAQSLPELVQSAAVLFTEHTQSDDEAIFDLLLQRGVDVDRAGELIMFVPLAFGRVLFGDSGPMFSPNYILVNPNTEQQEKHALRKHPVFQTACAVAEEWLQQGVEKSAFLAVAGRSTEVKVMNQAVGNGSRLTDLVLSEPVIVAESLEPPKNQRRWWRFW